MQPRPAGHACDGLRRVGNTQCQKARWACPGQVLGAGQYNGQFAIFDVRQGAAPVDATPVERSHRCACFGRPCKALRFGVTMCLHVTPPSPVLYLSPHGDNRGPALASTAERR